MPGNSAYGTATGQQRRWWPCICGHPAVNHQASQSGKTVTYCTIQTGPRPCGCARFTPADADPATVIPMQLRRLHRFRRSDGICPVCERHFLDAAGPCPGYLSERIPDDDNAQR